MLKFMACRLSEPEPGRPSWAWKSRLWIPLEIDAREWAAERSRHGEKLEGDGTQESSGVKTSHPLLRAHEEAWRWHLGETAQLTNSMEDTCSGTTLPLFWSQLHLPTLILLLA